MTDPEAIPPDVADIVARLATPSPMRRGSLAERYVKCSKQACACGQHEQARHGPYYSLTRAVAGKTQSRFLTEEQAAVARRQIEAARAFKTTLETYWQACERWADSELDASEAGPSQAAKKGGSRRRSRPRSSPKSKRS